MKKVTAFFTSLADQLKEKLTSKKSLKELPTNSSFLSKKKALPKEEPALLNNNFSIPKFWLRGLLVVFIGFLAYKALNMIYLLVTAVIISIALESFILSIEKRTQKRWLGIALSYIGLAIFLLSGVVFIIPLFVSQISALFEFITQWAIGIRDLLLNYSFAEIVQQITWIPKILQDALLSPDSGLSNLDLKNYFLSLIEGMITFSTSYIKSISTGIFSFLGGFFSGLGKVAIIFTLSIFISAEREELIALFLRKVPLEKEATIKTKIALIYTQLGLRLKAKFLLSLFVFLGLYLLLLFIKLFGISIPNTFSLSLLVGLLDIIPYIGPFLGLIPLVILAWVHNSFRAALIVLGIFILVQQLENNVITPVLMKKQLGV